MMKFPLPLSAKEIHVEWKHGHLGLGISAFTDAYGIAYIGLYGLTFDGSAMAFPVHTQRERLITPVVVGVIDKRPAVIGIDAEVSHHGLDVRFTVPERVAKDCPRLLWARWCAN